MTTYNYIPNVPDIPNDPSQDVPKMKINTNSIRDIIGVDHVGFGSSPGGYHNVIHQVTQLSDPGAISGVNEVYSKLVTPNYIGAVADTQLFTRTGNGPVFQLTGRNNVANGGWAWMGGILMIWGNVSTNFTVNNGTVTFSSVSGQTIPFPNAIFQVFTNLKGNSTTANTVQTNNLTINGFSWRSTNASATSYTGFSWLAMGN